MLAPQGGAELGPAVISSLFTLPEYDDAGRRFMATVMDALRDAKSPLLQEVRHQRLEEVPVHRVTAPSGQSVEMAPIDLASIIYFDVPEVVNGDFSSLYVSLDLAAERTASIMETYIIKHLGLVTDAIGNTVDAGGKPVDHDLLLQTWEKVDMRFDEEGNPIGLGIIAPPEVVDRLRKLPPPTPEQARAFHDLLARKRAEFYARRHRQRLS